MLNIEVWVLQYQKQTLRRYNSSVHAYGQFLNAVLVEGIDKAVSIMVLI